MSKLLLVTDTDVPDQLVVLVPDNYDENDLYETCGKMGMASIEIHEMVVDPVVDGELAELGIKPWREYWG